MALSLHELREAARSAGIEDVRRLPFSALVASIAWEESGGNPRVEPGDRGTSHGLLQIHSPDWQWVAAKTRAIAAAPLVTDYARAIAQIMVARPVFEAASSRAVNAAKILQERGMNPSLIDMLLLVDAAWQGPGLSSWASRTTTGQVEEIREGTSPGRTARVRRDLAELGVRGALDGGLSRWGWALPVGLVLGGGLLLWAATEAWD